MGVKFEHENGLPSVLFKGRLDSNTSQQAEEKLFEFCSKPLLGMITDVTRSLYL